MSVLEELLSDGISLIPIGDDKKPLGRMSWHAFKKIPATMDQLSAWKNKTNTFAIIHGNDSGTFGLDFEDKETFKEFFNGFEEYLKYAMIVNTPHGGVHVVFRCKKAPKRRIKPFKRNDMQVQLDILGEVGYGVILGEIDHTQCSDTHQNCPHEGMGSYSLIGYPQTLPLKDNRTVESWIDARANTIGWKKDNDTVDTGYIPEGRRHNAVVRFCSHLVNSGTTNEELLQRVMKYNKEFCQPALPQKEVEDIVTWFAERNTNVNVCELPDVRKEYEGDLLRIGQIDIIQKARNVKSKVFGIELPTGGGKTLAYLILARKIPTVIVLPDRAMQDQLLNDYGVTTLKGMSNYVCPQTRDLVSESPCTVLGTCSNECPYKLAVDKARETLREGGSVAANYANYSQLVALPTFSGGDALVIFDEIHQLLSEIVPFVEVPSDDLGNAMSHLSQQRRLTESDLETIRLELQNRKLPSERIKGMVKEFRKLQQKLHRIKLITEYSSGAYIVPVGKKHYARIDEESILRGLISNGSYGKILVSATLPFKLDIPLIRSEKTVVSRQNGPILMLPLAKINKKNESADPNMMDELAFYIRLLYDFYKNDGRTKKTIVHTVSTKRAEVLGERLRTAGHNVMVHQKGQLSETIEKFRNEDFEFLLTAAGTSGMDFYGDDFGLQFILKVPFPDLSDPEWSAKSARFGRKKTQVEYNRKTAVTLEQACGRIARGPNDIGVTVILDESFTGFYNNNSELFSNQFKERLVMN